MIGNIESLLASMKPLPCALCDEPSVDAAFDVESGEMAYLCKEHMAEVGEDRVD